MNSKYMSLSIIISLFCSLINPLYAQAKNPPKKSSESIININYEDEDLIDIINHLAAEKGVNVVLPVGVNSIKEKVSFKLDYDVSIEQAWAMLFTILEIAGYSLIPEGNLFTIVRTTSEIATEPLPLYVGTPVDELPDIEEQIRYIYYFTNLKITEEENNEIKKLLANLLPKNARAVTNQETNSLILVDTARNIKSIMNIIQALDKTEFKEEYEFIRLHYIEAETVAKLFKNILQIGQTPKYRLDTKRRGEAQYFSRHLKIIAEPNTNSLILLGRQQAIDRVKKFIYQYIDVELESGRSILHIYQLQYLDANSLASVLQKIVSSQNGPTGQAVSRGEGTTEQFFEGVIIRADTTKDEEPSLTETGLGEYKYYGGNKIIVAAKHEDWIRIRRLIEQLDSPQPQVIIEVLVADLTFDDTRAIASMLRNPYEMELPQDVNFQSAQASGIIVDNTTSTDPPVLIPPQTLAPDLLSLIPGSSPPVSIASSFEAGTTLVSFNERNRGQTWGLLELRKLFDDDKILSNPHVIATNNQRAEIIIGQRRLLVDQAAGSEGGTTNVTRKWVDANLIVNITPRISSADTVNLNVEIKIDRFQNPNANIFNTTNTQSQNNIDNRWVYTNANVHDKDVLALGGLTRVDFEKSISQTPLLGRVPILGYFFKDRSANNRKTNLTIFISPTIVQARLRGGTGRYTREYIEKSKEVIKEGYTFDSLQDPITRLFFETARVRDPIEEIDYFLRRDDFIHPFEIPDNEIGLAHINLDTETGLEDKQIKCCSPAARKRRMKKLMENEKNPLANHSSKESNSASSTRSK